MGKFFTGYEQMWKSGKKIVNNLPLKCPHPRLTCLGFLTIILGSVCKKDRTNVGFPETVFNLSV